MSGRPTSSVSSSRKPVTTGRWKPAVSRPVNGSSSSATPNSRMKNSPQRNSGSDSSTIEPASAIGSLRVPRTWKR